MSIINQMLHDLENRRVQTASTSNVNYFDLNSIPKISNSIKIVTLVYVLLITLALGSVLSVFFNLTENSNSKTLLSDELLRYEKTASVPPDTDVSKHNSGRENNKSQENLNKVPTAPVKVLKPKSRVEATSKTVSNVIKKNIIHKQRRVIPRSQQAQMRYQSAYDYLLANQQEKAQEELRNALMLKPGHNKSRELLAGIYIKNGRIDEARTLLQYGIRISPEHFIFSKLYARILMEQNDIVTAIAVLIRNPPTQETDSDYFALLAALYQKNKQHHQAAKLYGQLLTLRENYGVWWLGLAISLEALGNESQAKLAYEKAKNSGNLSKGLSHYSDQRVTALAEIAYP